MKDYGEQLAANDAAAKRWTTGCGKPTRVAGTNGGFMACGSKLTHLDGHETIEYCPNCSHSQTPQPGPKGGAK